MIIGIVLYLGNDDMILVISCTYQLYLLAVIKGSYIADSRDMVWSHRSVKSAMDAVE